MIVKILGSSGGSFHGVDYNDKKIDAGKGELMMMKNFPSFINENSTKEEVKDYLQSISISDKVKKPQFHATVSTKFREHSKEELAKIAENFMEEMGYGNQPFLVVFHNDTENNHIHIVTTRVDKKSGKKINDKFEKLKSQKALSKTMGLLYQNNSYKEVEKLLNYKISSLKQLEILLEGNGYKLIKNKSNPKALDILKNGVKLKTIDGNQIVFENNKNEQRAKQIKAILNKYKNMYTNKVFKVVDDRKRQGRIPFGKFILNRKTAKPKIDFQSELQYKMKENFGIEIVFNQKDEHLPFGYTLIDHKSGTVYKGSDLIKMNELFEFTSEKLDKKNFEILKDYSVSNGQEKKVLLSFLNKKGHKTNVQDFMLFGNKARKNFEIFKEIQKETRDHLKDVRNRNVSNENISIIKEEEDGKLYAIHSQHHFISELEKLVGEQAYQNFTQAESYPMSTQNEKPTEVAKAIDNLLFELNKTSGTANDPGEDKLKKRRKKRR